MTRKTSLLIEAITKHPQVSRVYANGPKIELLTEHKGLQALCRLRRQRRNAKQGIQNFRDEQAYGVSYEQGGLARAPKVPHGFHLLQLAYENREGLEPDLVAAIEAVLNHAKLLRQRGYSLLVALIPAAVIAGVMLALAYTLAPILQR